MGLGTPKEREIWALKYGYFAGEDDDLDRFSTIFIGKMN